MPLSNFLVVTVDGLRASALGAYGNTTYLTPALDRFAAESLLLDNCFTPSAELPEIYRALWLSLHPARPSSKTPASLAAVLGGASYQTTIVTDDPQVVALPETAQFDECVQVAVQPLDSEANERASESSRTELARFFAALSDAVVRPSKHPQLLWAHARGMYGLWDSPLDVQESLLDDDDPPPVESALPPDRTLRPGDDVEEVFRYGCAYGAQVMVLDQCWQNLMEVVDSAGGSEPWLVMLIGVRGFPLGEHHRIGGVDTDLHSDQLHVPWLVRCPDARGRLARSNGLSSPLDLLPTLLDWVGDDLASSAGDRDGSSVLPLAVSLPELWRNQLLSASADHCYSLRTRSWCLRAGNSGSDDGPTEPELYVRPDDRWEANDVAKLCPDIVDELHAAAADALGQLKSAGS